jgi:hypothetical protein
MEERGDEESAEEDEEESEGTSESDSQRRRLLQSASVRLQNIREAKSAAASERSSSKAADIAKAAATAESKIPLV